MWWWALIGAGVGGGDGAWAGRVGGEGRAMVVSSGCPNKRQVLCGAGVAGVALAC